MEDTGRLGEKWRNAVAFLMSAAETKKVVPGARSALDENEPMYVHVHTLV